MSILDVGLTPWYWSTLGTGDTSNPIWYEETGRVQEHRVEIVDMSNMSPEDAKKRVFGSITSEDFDNQKY